MSSKADKILTEPQSVKAGLVPTFSDGDESSSYRRRVVDWLLYMANAAEKKMSYGQQWYALLINVRGNARLRVDSFARRVPLELSENDFKKVTDTFLSLIDPIDREVQFIRTAEAWRSIQVWEYRGKKGFEDYWLTFSQRCLAYLQLHQAAEGNVAVRELLALTCVHNANLSRSEFTNILTSAMHWQELCNQEEENATRALAGILLDIPSTVGPPTVTGAYSRRSNVVGSSSETQHSPDLGEASAEHEEAADETVDIRTQTPADTVSDVTRMKLSLDDIRDHNATALQESQHQIDVLNQVLSGFSEAEKQSDHGLQLQQDKHALENIRVSLTLTKDILAEVVATANTVESSVRRQSSSSPALQPRTTLSSGMPLLTLDAVRVALRKLDASRDATRRQGDTLQSPLGYTRGRGRNRGSRGGRERGKPRGRGGKSGTSGGRNDNDGHICMVCKDNHNVYDNPVCKKKWLDYKFYLGEQAANFRPSNNPPHDEEGPPSTGGAPATRTGTSYWSDPPNALHTMLTTGIQNAISCPESRVDAIIDGGAIGTVVGLQYYHEICDELNIEPLISNCQDSDPAWHAFGVKGNASKSEEVVGNVRIPIPCGKGRFIHINAYVIDGNVPFIIAKPTLCKLGAIEDHARNYIEVSISDHKHRVRLDTFLGNDGHSRIPIRREHAMMNVSEAILHSILSTEHPTNSFNISDGKRLIDKIHSKTHIHPTSLRILLQRNKKWIPQMWEYAHYVIDNCAVCIRVGDPRPSRKISFTKLHCGFNDHIFVDIMYWSDRSGDHMVLNCVDLATSYSRLGMVRNRSIPHVLSVFETIWLHYNGICGNVITDSEFHNDACRNWFSQRGIKLSPVPSRRHNKAGIVERKNRVVKDVLEKLDNDPNHTDTPWSSRLSLAEFITNIMYGNQVASAFEMARGFTPGIAGLSAQALPNSIRVAYEETHARRLLSRIEKSRPLQRSAANIYQNGERVLVHVPGGSRKRGHWIETTVESVNSDGHVECGKGRHRRYIAHEDVRKIPLTSLARNVQRAELGMPYLQIAEKGTDDTDQSLFTHKPRMDEEPSSSEDEQRSDTLPSNDGSDSNGENRVTSHPGTDDSTDQNGITSPEPAESPSQRSRDGSISLTYVPTQYLGEETGQDGRTPEVRESAQSAPRRSHREHREPVRYTPTSLLPTAAGLSRDHARQKILSAIYGRMGSNQFMKHEAPDIPNWLYTESQSRELRDNWDNNKIDVPYREVPHDANVIGSHIVYMVKQQTEDPKILKLKSRICVHGNRDDEKEALRTDSAVASHSVFRTVYSLVVTFHLLLAKVDIQGAYTQSGKAHRDIYVKPPYELEEWNILWLLIVTIYGLVSAGRKWQRASDAVMIKNLGLSSIVGFHQLFYHAASLGALYLAKYVDDILIAAQDEKWLSWTIGGIGRAFKIGSISKTPDTITMNSTEIEVSDNLLLLHMRRYQKSEIELFSISPPRRKQVDSQLTATEIREVRRLAGKIGYLGTGVSPFASFAASHLQQAIPSMTVAGMKSANGIIREVLRRTTVVSYIAPSVAEQKQARIVSFSDAGYSHPIERKRAQEGAIFGVAFGACKGSIFHLVGYVSRSQKRLSQSSAAAETIAAIMSYSHAANIRRTYKQLTGLSLPLTLVIDSKGLHTSFSTEREPRDPSILADVALLREAYFIGDIDVISWIPGTDNPADPLTKPHAGHSADVLQWMLSEGRLPVDIDNRRNTGPALEEEL